MNIPVSHTTTRKHLYQPLTDIGASPKIHSVARKTNAASGRFIKLPSVGKQSSDGLVSNEDVVEEYKGRVTVYTTARSYKKKLLREFLESFTNDPKMFQDALYARFPAMPSDNGSIELAPEMFFFDYGVLTCWGMSEDQERRIMELIEPFENDKLPEEEVESDEFDFIIDPAVSPRILDDCITLSDIKDLRLRMSISYALSQSCKLSVFEEMIDRTIDKYQSVPVTLARTGKVRMTRKSIAKVIGQLFMQTSAVNLVSNVLDTPDFFWEEPDYLERLYSAVRGYLEITKRCDVLNRRLQVVSEMMGILKDEQHQLHSEKLEWIVIWLIVAELVVGIIGIVVTITLHFNPKHCPSSNPFAFEE